MTLIYPLYSRYVYFVGFFVVEQMVLCIVELLPESEPFTYLAFVKKKMPVSQPIRFHTKVCIIIM